MRILLNGVPVVRQRTGIGWYTLRLAQALEATGQVEAVGLATATRLLTLSQLQMLAPESPGSGHAAARRLVGRILPRLGRGMAGWLRTVRVHWASRDWSIFHETNYVGPRVACPLVTTVADLCYMRYPQFMPSGRCDWLRANLARSLERSRAVVAISRFTRDEILDCFPQIDPARVFTTALGVDHETFHPRRDEAEAAALREQYGLPPRFVLYLGTLEPRKNLQGLADGYALLPRELQQEFPLVLAGTPGWGSGYFHESIERLRQQGLVRLTGYVPQQDVPGLMRAASVFCFPSFYEGFGLPALEAAACGTPVLSAAIEPLREILGEAAEYVEPDSPDDIAAGLARLLEQDERRARLASLSIERAAPFTWARCGEATLAAYRAAA
ncbi:MAG: glycosyltransferase family 1 protein [Pirellulales bacterium]